MDLSGPEGEIPIPITSSYVVHNPSNRPPPLSTTNNTEDQITFCNTKKRVVTYRECLKNHAASMGGNATDGCGEFMPSGEEGTLEAFKCSACKCHRNFHRKEIEGEPSYYQDFYLKGKKGVLISGPDAYGYISRPPAPLIMPLGAIHTSESDDMEEGFGGVGVGVGVGVGMVRAPMVKKRFRTRFTQEQKEKMMVFAEKIGWRLQRQEEGLVQQFCQEIGVKRRVLKVWMHNNKHNLAKKSTLQLQ